MDTDSFFLYIETDNIYKGMHCLKKKQNNWTNER